MHAVELSSYDITTIGPSWGDRERTRGESEKKGERREERRERREGEEEKEREQRRWRGEEGTIKLL